MEYSYIVYIHIAAEGEMQGYDRHAYLNVEGSHTMLLVQSPTCSHYYYMHNLKLEVRT